MATDDADTRRLKDFAGTVVFLLVQAAVWRAAAFLTHGRPVVVLYIGLALLMVVLGVSVWRVARRRSAVWFALAGCVLQLVLGAVALSL
ncbi:hypothetical protein Mycch_4379 [Mycolicibacterium chubuense NBB4]|uniref:Uncharacterized protein n=1 Tax=Mycolicibacterium chubuense (strain NBB4) TaxID=710421 RepID=I4BP82_MYCCN|nr:hypothetical protein [Mycolicibacterium chubuense]AFM19089.1 hypothetical protein Mycch_4379 [Mycolicibacterium chubuense NBB4]